MTEHSSWARHEAQNGAPRPAAPPSAGGNGALDRSSRMPRSERRQNLLDAAKRVFVVKGFHATLMDDIADAAGVSKPVLYQHFPGKRELYTALLEHNVDDLVQRVRGAIESTTDNKQRVHAAIGAYFDFVEGDGQAFRLVFEFDLRGDAAMQDVVNRGLARCADEITAVVGGDTGLQPDRARLLAVGLLGMSQSTAGTWLDSKRRIPKEEAVSLIGHLAWRGIAGYPLQGDDAPLQ